MARMSTVRAYWTPGWAARMSRQMLSACSGSLRRRYCSARLMALGTAAAEMGLSSRSSLTLRHPPRSPDSNRSHYRVGPPPAQGPACEVPQPDLPARQPHALGLEPAGVL